MLALRYSTVLGGHWCDSTPRTRLLAQERCEWSRANPLCSLRPTSLWQLGTGHTWELHRRWRQVSVVTIHFTAPRATVRELAGLRKCLSELADLPPAEALARIGESGSLLLPELDTREATRLVAKLSRHGLRSSIESRVDAEVLAFDRTTGCALIMEDESEARRVKAEMMAAGVPVYDSES